MSTLDLRAASAGIRGTVGDDLTITVTVTDSGGSPIDLSGYTTIQADVLRNGTSIATFTDSLGGAGNNVITLSLTDAQTTSIGNERDLTWSLEVDADGSSVTQWLAGEFRLYTAGTPGVSSSTSVALTATGGVSLTATTVAPLATLDGRYAPITATDERIWVPAAQMTTYIGTPTLSATSLSAFWSVWLLNKTGSGEGVSGSVIAPPDWTSFDAYVWHVLPAAGSGNWRAIFVHNAGVTTGDDEVTGAASSINVIAAGAQDTIVRTLVKSNASVTGGELLLVRLARVDSGSTDTLTPDIALLGVELVGNPT